MIEIGKITFENKFKFKIRHWNNFTDYNLEFFLLHENFTKGFSNVCNAYEK